MTTPLPVEEGMSGIRRYEALSETAQKAQDTRDNARLVEVYIDPRRCRDCGHKTHPSYCCWHCGSANP